MSSSASDSCSGSSSWNLALVNPKKLRPTETVEEIRVSDLNEAIAEVIRDPLLTIKHGNEFLVIDGNTRTNLALSLKFPTLLIQVVDPKQVIAGTWVLRARVNVKKLIIALKKEGFQVGDSVSNPVCWITTSSDYLGVGTTPAQETNQVSATRVVVDLFKNLAKGKLKRVPDDAKNATRCSGKMVALKFAPLNLAQVINAAKSGELAGAGVPRWTLDGVQRALGSCMPLGIDRRFLEKTLKSPERISTRSFCNCGKTVHLDIRWIRPKRQLKRRAQ